MTTVEPIRDKNDLKKVENILAKKKSEESGIFHLGNKLRAENIGYLGD